MQEKPQEEGGNIFDFIRLFSILHNLPLLVGSGRLFLTLIFMRDLLFWICLLLGEEIMISTRKVQGRERNKLLRKYNPFR
jgi:hypothetical protein